MKLQVTKEGYLLDYLIENEQRYSKKDLKNLLTKGRIMVNGQVQTYYRYLLHPQDIIELAKTTKSKLPFEIIYEDQELIVINKPSGLLSMASERERTKTAYHLVSEYIKQENKKARLFIVHRLDQNTSGVLMFAKNEKIKNDLQASWNDLVLKRGYKAIVEGKMKSKEGTIQTYLKETKTQLVYSSKSKEGKLAITHYKTLKENGRYTLLEVYLDTGRKNQIRVHMQELGHPIIGDTKYGAKTNPIKRLGLHSHKLEFVHPYTKKIMLFEAKEPESFNQLFRKGK